MTLIYCSLLTFLQIPLMELILASFFLDFS